MKKIIVSLFYCTLLLTSIAHAKIPLYFGESDYFEKIESVNPVKIEEGKAPLYLGYRTYIKWFLAGVYMKDEGYVLMNLAKTEYMPLTAEMITELQAEKLLPEIIPTYKISIFQYIKGFSLWLIILAVLIYLFIAKKFNTQQ